MPKETQRQVLDLIKRIKDNLEGSYFYFAERYYNKIKQLLSPEQLRFLNSEINLIGRIQNGLEKKGSRQIIGLIGIIEEKIEGSYFYSAERYYNKIKQLLSPEQLRFLNSEINLIGRIQNGLEKKGNLPIDELIRERERREERWFTSRGLKVPPPEKIKKQDFSIYNNLFSPHRNL